MTDTTSRDGDTTRHDGLEAVSPVEAARRLGITPDSVRARLRRGTLPGEQRGREWIVFLEPEPSATSVTRGSAEQPATNVAPSPERDTDTTHRAMRHDTDTTERDAIIAAKDETIARQDAEIAFLREQLDQRSRELASERERSDTIQQMALLRIEQALTAGTLDLDTSRQDAPVSDSTGRSTTEPPPVGDSTHNEPPEHRPSVFASLLDRLRGRG